MIMSNISLRRNTICLTFQKWRNYQFEMLNKAIQVVPRSATISGHPEIQDWQTSMASWVNFFCGRRLCWELLTLLNIASTIHVVAEVFLVPVKGIRHLLVPSGSNMEIYQQLVVVALKVNPRKLHCKSITKAVLCSSWFIARSCRTYNLEFRQA